jgi:hypothetical protein
MSESKCLVEEEAKISSLNLIQRTFLLFISNINIQFGAIDTGMRKNVLCSVFIVIMFTGLTIIPISLGVTPAYAQESSLAPDNNQGPPPPFPIPYGQQPPFGQSSNFTFGPIASIQNNETGQPAWLVIGHWRSNLLSFNQTTTTTDNSDGNSSSIEGAVFSANLRMIMLNGSGAHTHVITNFVLSNVSSNENGTMTYTGNSTISMPEAPIVDVPTTIKISGEIISIFPDPSSVEGHFGDTPIYGAAANGPDNNGRGPPPSGQQQQPFP